MSLAAVPYPGTAANLCRITAKNIRKTTENKIFLKENRLFKFYY